MLKGQYAAKKIKVMLLMNLVAAQQTRRVNEVYALWPIMTVIGHSGSEYPSSLLANMDANSLKIA